MSTATLGVLHTSYPVAMRVAHELLSAQFTVVDAEKDYLLLSMRLYTMHNKFSNCFVWLSPSTSDLEFHLLS